MTTVNLFEVGDWHGAELHHVLHGIINWLIKTYGTNKDQWVIKSIWIYFCDPRDETLFLLRWSGV